MEKKRLKGKDINLKIKEDMLRFSMETEDSTITLDLTVDTVTLLLRKWHGILRDFKYKTKVFIINEYLKLKLERGKTNIYVKDEIFQHCKFLFLNIPVDDIKDFDEIKSIDEASEKLNRDLEGISRLKKKLNITPEQEFEGHCSNLHAWYENDYDTRLLHRNLAFPLLKKLSEAGDPLAKRAFKEEITLRLESGEMNVIEYLRKEKGYLELLSKEEREIIIKNVINPIARLYLKTIFGLDVSLRDFQYDFKNKGFFSFDRELLLCAYDHDPLKESDEAFYQEGKDIFGPVKCSYAIAKKFLDFKIPLHDGKKTIFPVKKISLVKEILNQNPDIQIFIPAKHGPLKITSKSEELRAYIAPTSFEV